MDIGKIREKYFGNCDAEVIDRLKALGIYGRRSAEIRKQKKLLEQGVKS